MSEIDEYRVFKHLRIIYLMIHMIYLKTLCIWMVIKRDPFL